MQQPSGNFRLIVRRGPQPNQVHEMTKDVITLGRDITNDITINDPEVSRHHARLTRGGGGYTMEDLGSTNGTFVNGQRLSGARPLSPGDMIGLGETVTLAYEATAMAGMGMGAAPAPEPPRDYYQQQGYGQAPQPAQPQAPYGQQQPPYAPSPYAPPPPAGYPSYSQPGYGDQSAPIYAGSTGGYEMEPQGPDWTRWLLLGCGCFIVLCVLGSVISLIVIDSSCLWDDLGPISEIFDLKSDAEKCPADAQ